jgi:hypothetical protein
MKEMKAAHLKKKRCCFLFSEKNIKKAYKIRETIDLN